MNIISEASNGILKPRFPAHVLKMSFKELKDRLAYVSRYMQNISPKVSIYTSLEHERVMLQDRLHFIKHHGKDA